MKRFLFVPSIALVSVSLAMILLAFSAYPTQAQTPTQEISIEVPDDYSPESGLSLTLSPVFLTLSVDPGEAISSQFRITNNNDFAEYLEVELVKIEASQDGTSPVIADLPAGDEFASWTTYSPKEFILNPNQEQIVRVTIDTPDDAALGYYYGFVVKRLGEKGEEELTEPGTAISGAAAISLLLSVNSPDAKSEIQIMDFTTDKLFYEYLPTTFKVRVKNTGNIHVVPFGDIFIDSLFNDEIAILPANGGKGNVLPGIDREFSVVWDDGFPYRAPKEENGVIIRDENGNIEYETKYDFSKADKFRFGRYTASLIMVYDNGERDVPIEATVTFWVIPWKIFGIGIVVALLVLLGLRSILMPLWRNIRGNK